MEDIDNKKEEDVQWHPAFVVALEATLIDYADALEYKPEHPLNVQPQRIDVIVIRKLSDVVIRKQIAEIFRRENIFEYKSPADNLSVDEFHKALSRLHLYKALEKNVDIPDLTLNFAISAYPRELLLHLSETLGYTVEERHPGILWVTGAMIPIQIRGNCKTSKIRGFLDDQVGLIS